MKLAIRILILSLVAMFSLYLHSAVGAKPDATQDWNQWRGPSRDGQVKGADWPETLAGNYLELAWQIPLGPSYSGPVTSANAVFVTETKDKSHELVRALSRTTGKELWKAEWQGSIEVPFFAKSRGDWIRATPAYDGNSLFVSGMRDVLVSLNAKTGKEQWRVDFSKQFNSPLPEFGLVCSPLIDGNALYIQASNATLKLDKTTGKIIWRVLAGENNIMSNGAFSSPVLAEIAGTKQLVVQTREQLAGLDPETGKTLWIKTVPSFRGMNILTPVVFGDTIFTSSYQNKSWLYRINKGDSGFSIEQAWENTAQGYMSTPVVIDGHAYLHLGNQRFTCINLKTGERTWTSGKPFGKYVSLVAQRDRILALDERGILLLIKANPKEFELLSERQISESETWAHLALSGDELFIRELNGLSAFRWRTPKDKPRVE
ncbi:MAG: PQQ-binding-like beta-propeller repeat protein [Blastocatellia bacterium]